MNNETLYTLYLLVVFFFVAFAILYVSITGRSNDHQDDEKLAADLKRIKDRDNLVFLKKQAD
jgi:hypothetical protein